MPINTVISSITPLGSGPSQLAVKGYAIGGSAGPIVAVELSTDQGTTWQTTTITYQHGKWSWTLWEAVINVVGDQDAVGKRMVLGRAKDETGNVQQQQGSMNAEGVACNSFGRSLW
jgi:sulfite oxidase